MPAQKRGAGDASDAHRDDVVAGGSEPDPGSTAASGAPAPDEFRSFMVALATDPAKLGAFIKDPDRAMTDAGIDAVDQVILKSGNPSTIHARLKGLRFSFTPPAPPTPVTILVVDMTRQSGAAQSAAHEQLTVRAQAGSAAQPSQWGATMFPNYPQYPQIPVPPIYPQVFPQIHPQQVFPQIHPQQIYTQIHPLQIYPQVHPQVFPQIHPQQVFPQIHPQQIYPQIHPLQIYPQVHPQQVFPQIHPQLVNPGSPG